jgi:hypothetical protein
MSVYTDAGTSCRLSDFETQDKRNLIMPHAFGAENKATAGERVKYDATPNAPMEDELDRSNR